METSQLNFIDTHCHLYSAEFDVDRIEMIRNAVHAGVRQMMMPNIDLDTVSLMLQLVTEFPGVCYPMMGLHPCSVKENYKEILQHMKGLIDTGSFAGVGETGIDLYWDTTYKGFQIEAFEQQISWGKEFDLPVIIHSRESLELNIDIIASQQGGRLRGIFHCFGGDYDQAIRIYELGFKIGIGGVVTFKKSGLADVLPRIPSDIILLETDAPYLAPSPYRGKRNEPAYLPLIAGQIALLLGLSLDEVANITYQNALDVFRKKG